MIGVLEEARFFGIDSLIEHLEVAIKVRLFLHYPSITCIVAISQNAPLICQYAFQEFSTTRRSFTNISKGICPISASHSNQIRIALPGN